MAERQFLAPAKAGERWLGEAETERGNGANLSLGGLGEPYSNRRRSPLSDRFAATSPPFHEGEEP